MADTDRAGSDRNLRRGMIERFASKLRYPQLFFAVSALFVIDLFVPDLIPFADEALLGLLAVLLGRIQRPRAEREPADDGSPRMKNVTPPSG